MRVSLVCFTGLSLSIVCFALAGCENSEVWDELNGTPPAAATPASQAEPEPARRESMPAPAEPHATNSNHVQMIQSLQPFDITDQHMRELTSQSDGLGELTELDLERSQVTAAGLTDIGRLTGLRVLNLSRMPVDAEILAQLESMSGLESLALNRSDVNDSLLGPLENLTSLRELYLNQTAVTDEGLRRLRNLINLEVIDVSSNRIDGSGFQVFRDMRDACRLREIVAHHTRFGDDGPRNIAGIETLERLALSQGGVDDSSLSSFAKCPNLIELDLSFNNISINGLRKLSRLRHVQLLRLQNNREIASSSLAAISKWDELKSLELDGTSVGLPAVRQMKELHPDLVIHWNGQEY